MKERKNIKLICTIFVIGIFLFSTGLIYGGGEKKLEKAQGPKKVKVAVLLPGVISDHSWNQFAYEGLMRAKKECGVEVAYSENVHQAEQIEVFRNYASAGYDVIIGHGGEYTDAAETVAKEFPKVKFCITNGLIGHDNVSSFKVSYSQMSFLAGVLAGEMTKANKVAMVVAEPIPIVEEGIKSFKDGVKYAGKDTGKDIEVFVVKTGSWDDVVKAREASLSLINKGADVLFHIMDIAEVGLISAAEDKGVYAIGLYRDSTSLGPKAIIGSAIGSPATLVYEAACGHVLNGKANTMTVNTPRGIDILMTDLVPENIQKRVKKVVEDMRSGKLYVKP